MALQVIQNKTGYVNPELASVDTGWSVSGGYAIHVPCNSGTIKSIIPLNLVIGQQYTFQYEVDQYKSGGVKLLCGTSQGVVRTANGIYTDTLFCSGNQILSFFSDGGLRVGKLKFFNNSDDQRVGTTISFHEGSNTWGSEYTFYPELLINFIDSFLTIKDGGLWLHDSNPLRNNFYGQQFVSKVKFYVNGNPTMVKLFYSVRVEANSRWFSPEKGDISIVPTEGNEVGMKSRIKKNDFQNYQGSFFADFRRNMDDPRFTDELLALFGGAELRGRVMEVILQNEETNEAILFEVDIKSAISNYSY